MSRNHQNEFLNEHLNMVAEKFLREIIRAEYPEWIDHNGECKKCDEYYDSLLDVVQIK